MAKNIKMNIDLKALQARERQQQHLDSTRKKKKKKGKPAEFKL